jgi:hypothetical protein
MHPAPASSVSLFPGDRIQAYATARQRQQFSPMALAECGENPSWPLAAS